MKPDGAQPGRVRASVAVRGTVAALTPAERALLLGRRPADDHRVTERVRQILADVRVRGDRALLFMTMFLTVVTDLTVAIGVGTVAGLSLRLMRRDVEPAEWNPAERSKL